jgi:hypothetical protein
MYSYPVQFAEFIRTTWSRKVGILDKPVALPRPQVLRAFLEVAYHASFTVDEGRNAQFCVAYCTDRQWDTYWSQWGDFESLAFLRLAGPKSYDESQLRRLAAATTAL